MSLYDYEPRQPFLITYPPPTRARHIPPGGLAFFGQGNYLLMRPSLLHDPEIAQKIAYQVALGLPQVRIAEALQLPKQTINGWLKKKSFKTLYAVECLERLTPPLEAVCKSNPLAYLERHPETRQTWGKDPEAPMGVIVNLISRGSCETVDVELVQPRQIEGKVTR